MLALIGRRRFDRFGMLTADLTVVPWRVGEPDESGDSSADADAGRHDSGSSAASEAVWLGFIRLFLAQHAGRHLGADTARRLMTVANRNGALLAPSSSTHLGHSDFNVTNILIGRGPEGWRVTGVLDWEWAHSGAPTFDIGNLLRRDDLTREPFRATFAEGFQANGDPLPEDWHDRALLIDLLNLLEMINKPKALHPHQERMIRRIEHTLAHFGS